MTRSNHQGGSRRIALILRWVLTVGMLGVVAWQVDFRQLGRLFSDVRWAWMALAVVAVTGDRIVATVRWWMLLRVKSIVITYARLLKLHFAATFVGSFLPTSFGADAARIILLSRQTGRTMETIAASAVDRSIMIVTTLLMAGAMSILFVRSDVPAALQWVVAGIAVLCVGGVVTVTVVAAFKPAARMVRKVVGHRAGDKLAMLYWSVHEFRQHPAALLGAFAFSGLLLVIRVMIIFSLARSLSIDLSVLNALKLWPIAAVVLMLPISVGNFGLQEGTYAALLGAIGIPLTAAVSISLLDHLLARVVVLPGALLWLLRPNDSPLPAEPIGQDLSVLSTDVTNG